ncbi:MAG: DUF4465 domain-containing protein, partial [Paludibacteraceae bacterium]|nr:DUF4465 domain-containing protein [Paludibacteraceae bacterium]
MKNLHSLPIVAAACCMMHAAAADTITLNLNIPTAPAEIQLNTSGYWTETYNTEDQYQHLEFGLYSFTHNIGGNGGEDLMSGMMSWNGFTYSTNSDTTNYALEGSSAAWIDNQWGCMAGGGILTDTLGRIMMRPDGCPQTDSGVPYLIGYWSFKSDADDNRRSLQIDFTDQQLHRLVGTWICNHPWPYYGNRYGDGFASKMENNGEHFRLVAHGLNSRLEDTGTSVTLDLAS